MNDTTIHLISGAEFDYLDPMAAKFTTHDVAHALARVSRYGGHCLSEWSVAQHTLLVGYIVKHVYDRLDLALGALHHDDVEFVTGDWPTPLKAACETMGFSYRKQLESRIEPAICAQLGLVMDDLHARAVKDADHAAYQIEVEMLKPKGHHDLEDLGERFDGARRLAIALTAIGPTKIEELWMRFDQAAGGEI